MKPTRVRSQGHMAWVRTHPCLVCGSPYVDAHHLTHAQPRAMAKKTGDQYTVPLCRTHHMKLHEAPMSEQTWWDIQGIDPIEEANKLWRQSDV